MNKTQLVSYRTSANEGHVSGWPVLIVRAWESKPDPDSRPAGQMWITYSNYRFGPVFFLTTGRSVFASETPQETIDLGPGFKTSSNRTQHALFFRILRSGRGVFGVSQGRIELVLNPVLKSMFSWGVSLAKTDRPVVKKNVPKSIVKLGDSPLAGRAAGNRGQVYSLTHTLLILAILTLVPR